MADQPITVAGAPLGLLEEALDHIGFEVAASGCISANGTHPDHLGRCLVRALISMEVEMLEHGLEPYSGPGTDPFQELLVRVIAARAEA